MDLDKNILIIENVINDEFIQECYNRKKEIIEKMSFTYSSRINKLDEKIETHLTNIDMLIEQRRNQIIDFYK